MAFSISGARQSDNGYRMDGLIVNDYANACLPRIPISGWYAKAGSMWSRPC